MTTLCSAFGVFSAFGAAILAFFTAGGAFGKLSDWVAKHGKLRWGDAVVVTVITVVAVLGGAIAALPSGKGSDASKQPAPATGQAVES
jgi:hypothetical protein